MSSALRKSLEILELMARHPEGLPVSVIAERLDAPVSGVHRQLKELARLGYVRQKRSQGDYALTLRLAAIGLNYLGEPPYITKSSNRVLSRDTFDEFLVKITHRYEFHFRALQYGWKVIVTSLMTETEEGKS